ncbi:formate/nitrite transporter family protein [Halobacteriovorax sp. HLS]|uniref:formate/nitrite transporter family protein n=1 Tax=Halobacteriovorax sp. HLS TaxID=2234000 RepID=UPI000FD91054|nr:formate/nitrite transporter family protein [Halobacteriovorax sp. HLS]
MKPDILDHKVLESMYSKSELGNSYSFLLGIASGVFISTGAFIFVMMLHLDFFSSLNRLFASSTFSIGLILIIFSKTQLFTGNNLMIRNLLSKNISGYMVLKNWTFVYLGNLIGALGFVVALYFLSPTVLDERFIEIAIHKLSLGTITTIYKAILCNILVCIAVALAIFFEKKLFKVIAIVIPITLFVFLGFEHSVANMFFVPMGLILKGDLSNMQLLLLLRNLSLVTFGNIAGGALVSLSLYFFLGAKVERAEDKVH